MTAVTYVDTVSTFTSFTTIFSFDFLMILTRLLLFVCFCERHLSVFAHFLSVWFFYVKLILCIFVVLFPLGLLILICLGGSYITLFVCLLLVFQKITFFL